MQLPFNIFWSTMFTMDAIDELNDDLLMPSGDHLSFQDLGINPQKASLAPLSLRPSNAMHLCTR